MLMRPLIREYYPQSKVHIHLGVTSLDEIKHKWTARDLLAAHQLLDYLEMQAYECSRTSD